MTSALTSPLLVTGASGKLGRRVAELLLEAGATNLTAASRDPTKLADLDGVATRTADFDDPATLDDAFAGIERLLIVSTDAVDVAGRRKRQHRAAVDAAVKAGVRHIVYTSMPNPEPGSLIPFAPDHHETEQAIAASGVGYTILRNSWYTENLLGTLAPVLASGKWFTSARDGRIAYVAREDTARAAAAALASAVTASRRLDVAGPEPLSVAQIAAIAGDVFGKQIEVIQVSDEELTNGLRAAGVPEVFIPLIVATDANARAGKFDVSTDVIEQLTGRKPQSVRAFLKANRAALAPGG